MSAYLFLPNIDQESINQISYPEIAPAPPSAALNTPVGLPPAKRSEGARFDKGPGFWPKHRGIQGGCVKWGLFLQAGISAKMVRFGRFPFSFHRTGTGGEHERLGRTRLPVLSVADLLADNFREATQASTFQRYR